VEIKDYVNEYVEIAKELTKVGCLSTDVAIAILQERGKDGRQNKIDEEKANEPATEKQKDYMKVLGVDFSENITKQEASRLIEEAKKSRGTK